MAKKAGKSATAVKEPEVKQEAAKDTAEKKNNGFFLNGVSNANILAAKDGKGKVARIFLPKEATPENQKLRADIGVSNDVSYVTMYIANADKRIFANTFNPKNSNILLCSEDKKDVPINVRTNDKQDIQMTPAQLETAFKKNKAEGKDIAADKQAEVPEVAPEAAEAAPDVDPTDGLW